MQTRLNEIPAIRVEMLGRFSVAIGDKVLTDGTERRRQMWYLLQYLLANRNRSISQEKLIETLWEDDESENPLNALKNLVYRLRTLTKSLCPDQTIELIVFKNNSYTWNNSLPCTVDTELFEQLARQANAQGLTDGERAALLRQAVDLYYGEFLPGSAMLDWVIIESARFGRIYLDCVQKLSALLRASGETDEMIAVCERAIEIYPFEESLHELLIRAHIDAGNRQKAMVHYQHVSDMFYEKMGVKMSKNLRQLMNDIVKSMNGIENDLDVIKEDLREQSSDNAFFCEYEIFKNLYRVEARLASRFGQAVFVALISLEPADKLTLKLVSGSMDLLKNVILKNLRKSDVVARYSNSQYVLMLPSLTYENGQMVLRRIIRKFDEDNKNKAVYLSAKLNPLTPAG